MPAHPDPKDELFDAEQRRHLTILFTDLSDSTHLSGAMEAETYAEMLNEVRTAFRDAVARHGGAINQFQGDGLQAVFGFPHATEHDGRRAVEAALAVHAAVRLLRIRYAQQGAPDLSVHSGIHSGVVLAREGDNVAGRVEIFGPGPGIAKHLSDVAEADEILVSEETLGPGSHLFETAQRRFVTLKGRAEPLAIHRILGRMPLRTRFEAHARRGLVPFVGRHEELAWLQRALDGAIAGRARFVAVSAPPGVGKTRLAEEFLQRFAAPVCTVSRGYCGGDLSAEPLQPFLQMLRARFGLVPGMSPAAAAQAIEAGLGEIDAGLLAYRTELMTALSVHPEAPGTAEPRRSAPEQTLAAVREVFAALARLRPQVLFIDDWHWADDATRQVVYAIRDLGNVPVLLLVATRPPELGDVELTGADHLALAPFSAAEADATIGELLPAADPFVAGEIRRYSGGNPLFIEELCHAVARAGPSAGLDPVRGGPAWLETLIESRVARLPRDQAHVLSAAAVIGNVVPTWLLERLTGCGEDHLWVRALAAQDLVFAGEANGTLRFKHGITRDVVYGAVGLQKRRAMHREIAKLIQADARAGDEADACEALAYHFAGAGEYAEATRYAATAGDKAMAASSIDAAKAQYGAALGMLDRLAASAERYQAWRSIVRRLGLATVFDPSRAELAIFHRAVARAREHGDAAGEAYAEYWLAYVNYALGESRAAVEHCELAVRAATVLGDQRLAAQARATLGQALAAAADYGGALALLDDTTRLRRDRETETRPSPGLAYALACKASVLGDLGRFPEAMACFDDALACLPWRGHEVEGSVLCWRSGVNLWQGRWEAARQDSAAAQAIAERVRSLYLFAMSRGLGAYAAWHGTRDPRLLQDMAEAATWLESRDKNLFVSLVHGWLAEALATAGQPAEARRQAARALRRVRKRDWFGGAMACRAMARLQAAAGDWRAAERHLRRAERVARTRSSPHETACNDLAAAEIALARGDRDGAAAGVERASAAFESMRMHWHLAQAARLRAQFQPR